MLFESVPPIPRDLSLIQTGLCAAYGDEKQTWKLDCWDTFLECCFELGKKILKKVQSYNWGFSMTRLMDLNSNPSI